MHGKGPVVAVQHRFLLWIANYGYFGIFGALVLGIVGVPLPDEVLMTFSGYMVARGQLHLIPTVLVAAFGSLAGMSISYVVGRRLGYAAVVKYGKYVHLSQGKLDRTQRWFAKFGGWMVTAGYFVPGVRHLTAYLAGISKWRYRSFAFFAAPGALLWATTFILLGAYFGRHWRVFAETLHRYLLMGVAGAAVAVLIVVWLRRRRAVPSRN